MIKQPDQPLRIAVAGLGTVGGGVVRLLQDNAAVLAARAGRPLSLTAVSARDKSRKRDIDLSGLDWAEDATALADPARYDVVVELIGGAEGPARRLVERALDAGMPVVTANKALLAHHGVDLARRAEQSGAPLLFEAAVAGGIPIIKQLREGLAANNIHAVYGILNGTCNYILTTMRETGQDFAAVLKSAQDQGYAEADPAFDIDGTDAAHKLSLLTALAFGTHVDLNNLPTAGIRNIMLDDILHADELGYRIKLLGMARRFDDGRVSQIVEPCLIPIANPVAAVEGVLNAVCIQGDFVGTSLSVGRGAGAGPTASAVVADLIDLARGHAVPAFGVGVDSLIQPLPANPDDCENEFYLRLRVLDQPGVLADIAAIMRDHRVSLEVIVQRGRDPDQPVNIAIITHKARRGDIRAACARISTLSTMATPPCLMRIERL